MKAPRGRKSKVSVMLRVTVPTGRANSFARRAVERETAKKLSVRSVRPLSCLLTRQRRRPMPVDVSRCETRFEPILTNHPERNIAHCIAVSEVRSFHGLLLRC